MDELEQGKVARVLPRLLSIQSVQMLYGKGDEPGHPSVKPSVPSVPLHSSLFSCGKACKRRDRSLKLGVNIKSGEAGDFQPILCDFKDNLSLHHSSDRETKDPRTLLHYTID